MLLAIDVGNTNTKFAIWDGAAWRAQWRASTDSQRTADEYAPWLTQIMALSAGDKVNSPPQGAAEIAGQQGAAGLSIAANMLAWPALKRKAYRLDPSFAS